MNNPFFTGVCTALVTPFENGKINLKMLEKLLNRQMEAGINTIVIGGTTGEASTLSDAEKQTLFRSAKEITQDPCRIIAGTGSNDTSHAISLSIIAEDEGADALLIVSPYYNKATPAGLIAHYQAIAAAVHIPIILYNVPSRTGVDISPEVCCALARTENIIGIKEASTDITKTGTLLSLCPADFTVWGGNDDQAVPIMSMGAAGIISVLSNIFPVETQAMAQAALAGDFDTAAALQIELMPLIRLLFSEVNPIPVKAALGLLGYDCGNCRLPLTPISDNLLEKLRRLLT